MKIKFYFLALLAVAMFATSCKPNNDVKNPGDLISEKDTMSHWMSLLPDETLLCNLTIPCLHDAATSSYPSDYFTSPSVKDQDLYYDEAWKIGARAFDLRIAYIYDASGFANSCRFCHGDYAFLVSWLNIGGLGQIDLDIEKKFPTEADLEGECMFLIVKKEYMDDEKYTLNVFEYLMANLIKRYGKDRFIAYHDGMTLGEARGKIVLFVRDEIYTHNYQKEVGGSTTPLVPINYLTCFRDNMYDVPNPCDMHVYVNAEKVASYKYFSQDIYELNSKDDYSDKYLAVELFATLEQLHNPGFLCFNGMNAYEPDATNVPYSWGVCKYMNQHVSELYKTKYTYGGIVLCDMYGVDVLERTDFSGTRLARAMIRSNFKK